FFTIYNQKRRSTDGEAINLPFGLYWCIAARGDLVLLGRGSTDHYTMIASIDHERQTVDMIDRWPNTLLGFSGIASEIFTVESGALAGRKLVRFLRPDFERLFLAAITFDTADLVQLLERSLPAQAWTPELYIALGRSLLYAGKYKSFAAPAADLIIEGVRAAGRAQKHDLVEASIPVMFTAVAVAHSFHVAKGNDKAASRARQYRDEIIARYGSAPIERLSAEDALRIGMFAFSANDLE